MGQSDRYVLWFALFLLLAGIVFGGLNHYNNLQQKAVQEKLERERSPKDSTPKFWR